MSWDAALVGVLAGVVAAWAFVLSLFLVVCFLCLVVPVKEDVPLPRSCSSGTQGAERDKTKHQAVD